jgi:hypothetical protein
MTNEEVTVMATLQEKYQQLGEEYNDLAEEYCDCDNPEERCRCALRMQTIIEDMKNLEALAP